MLAGLALACGGGGGRHLREGSPTGVLAFADLAAGRSTIRIIRQDGTGDEPLPGLAGGPAFDPSFSLATGQIAFQGYRDLQPVLVLHAWRDDVEQVLQVGDLHPAVPALAPDGSSVAFEGSQGAAKPDIYLLPVAGGAPVRLAEDPATDSGPAWASDGKAIYFGSLRTGQWEIFRVAVDGSGLTQITTGSRLVGKVAVSPAGHAIAYAQFGGSNFTRVVVRSLDDGTERVISGAASESEPDFDPAGANIAVTSTLYGTPCILLRDAATGALVRRLTERPGSQSAPAFAR